MVGTTDGSESSDVSASADDIVAESADAERDSEAVRARLLADARGIDHRVSTIDELLSLTGGPTLQGRASMHLSAHAIEAALDHGHRHTPVDLRLRQVAPLLLESFGGPCERADKAGDEELNEAVADAASEFELAIGHRLARLTRRAHHEEPANRVAHDAVVEMLMLMLGGACSWAPVSGLPTLISISHAMSYERDDCSVFYRAEGLALSFGSREFLATTEHSESHLRQHQRFARAWRFLAASLSARLDGIGRRLVASEPPIFEPRTEPDANQEA